MCSNRRIFFLYQTLGICLLLILNFGSAGAWVCALHNGADSHASNIQYWYIGNGCPQNSANNWFENAPVSCTKTLMYGTGKISNKSCVRGDSSTEDPSDGLITAASYSYWCRAAGKTSWVCVYPNNFGSNANHLCGSELMIYPHLVSWMMIYP